MIRAFLSVLGTRSLMFAGPLLRVRERGLTPLSLDADPIQRLIKHDSTRQLDATVRK